MYPNRSPHGEITRGIGNQESSSLVPWKRRVAGFKARTEALTSSGSCSSRTGAGLMRFTLSSSLSSGTLVFNFRSFTRPCRSRSVIFSDFTKSFGIDVDSKNSFNRLGTLEVEPGIVSIRAGAGFTAFFTEVFCFVVMAIPRCLHVYAELLLAIACWTLWKKESYTSTYVSCHVGVCQSIEARRYGLPKDTVFAKVSLARRIPSLAERGNDDSHLLHLLSCAKDRPAGVISRWRLVMPSMLQRMLIADPVWRKPEFGALFCRYWWWSRKFDFC